MAGLGRKQWSPGDVLTASDVNGYLMDQSVMVFAGTAARASAIPSPSAGMVAYSTATGLEIYDGSSFTSVTKVLQVVSVFKADAFSMTGSTYVDVTGLSVSITPQATTSKIVCMGQINTSTATGEQIYGQLLRDATVIGNGTGGSGVNAIVSSGASNTGAMDTSPFFFVDSPATTSATTYKIQIKTSGAGVVGYINRRHLDTAVGGSSSLILMEVSA